MMGPKDTISNLSDERFKDEFDEVKRHFEPMVEGRTNAKTYASAKRAVALFTFEAQFRAGDQAELVAAYAARVARGEG